MPPVPFLVLSHGWVFVTEGFSVVLTVLVFFQEGLNDGVLVGMFHVEMSVYEPEVDCSKGVQCVDVMVSVCYVAMLVPPQVSLDVGPAPCEAGPAGYGYPLTSLVEWHTLRFQISMCAAMMDAVKFVDVMVSVCYVEMLMPPQVSLDVGLAPCEAGPAGYGYALTSLVEWHTLRFQISMCAAMMAAVKFVDVMVSVCYAAMLMLPQVSLDVGPAPCVAGPAGFGYALALVEWHTLRFQPFFVCAAMMASDGVYMM